MASIFPQCDERLLDAIRNASGAVIVSHRNPDGDAIASTLAMDAILRKMGKKTEILSDGPFLRSDIKRYEGLFRKETSDGFIQTSPLAIIVDCSTPDRPGEAFNKISGLDRIVIDHHSSGIPFTSEGMSYIVPASPSTTLCINEVRKALGIELDKEIAYFLYFGFATDSGFYHFLSDKTAPDALEAAASFCRVGISPYDVYDDLHDGRKLSDIKDMAAVIQSAEPVLSGKFLFAYQSESMKDGKLSDGVYASLLEAEGILGVVLFKDKGDSVEIGFRSKHKSGIDVGKVASELGGGGHMHAAGATVQGSVGEARETLVKLLEGYIS